MPWQEAPGRYTGSARHLTDPANKIYIGTMEEGFYEIDVNALKAKELYKDSNEAWRLYRKDSKNTPKPVELLPGAHGKGLYSGQGVMVFSNNGENSAAAMEHFDALSGSLSEWDGKDWKVVRRNQFVELTGPGGIYGNTNPETDPIWIRRKDGPFIVCLKQVILMTVHMAGILNGHVFVMLVQMINRII